MKKILYFIAGFITAIALVVLSGGSANANGPGEPSYPSACLDPTMGLPAKFCSPPQVTQPLPTRFKRKWHAPKNRKHWGR